MTESVTPPTGSGPAPMEAGGAKGRLPIWATRTIIGVVAGVVLVVGYLVASVTVPLMWANSIKDQIGTELGNSIPLGMFYGFVFTFVPLLILWQARRRKLHKWVRISLAALAFLLLIPNLLTLGVLYGGTQTATDARTLWAIGANWFGTWSQIFMLVGVSCAIAVIVLGRMLVRRSRDLRELKAAEKLVRKEAQSQQRQARATEKAAGKSKPAAGGSTPPQA